MTELREHPAFWQSALQQLGTMTTPEMFKSWLLPLKVQQVDDQSIILRVPNAFFTTFLKSNFESKISSALSRATGKIFRISYSVGQTDADEAETPATETRIGLASAPLVDPPASFPQSSPFNAMSNFETRPSRQSLSHAPTHGVKNSRLVPCTSGYLDGGHSFDNFIVSAGTQFAHATSKHAASYPGSKYNPLLIYGPSGLGKTHLLHAIGIEMLRLNPQAKICYLPAEQFVNEFINAVRNKTTNEFHARYRSNFDAFLIDDIQHLAGKERSEEEFFHTFNYLFGSKNQLVLTSDKPPKDLHGLEDRMISRLQQGLSVDVKPPDLETRIAILKAKAEADDLFLPEEVCLYVAGHIRNNVRELEGALVRLSADASINGTEITLDMAKEALNDLISEGRATNLSVDSICKCVSQYFKLSLVELSSKSREQRIAVPRQIAMYLTKKYTKKTYPEIGKAFGGKDHSTVIHACRKVESGLHSNPVLKKQVEDIQQML